MPKPVHPIRGNPIITNETAGLYIEWDEPESHGLSVTAYEVTITGGGFHGAANATTTHLVLQKLTLSTVYRVSVRAISVIGRSNESTVELTTSSGMFACSEPAVKVTSEMQPPPLTGPFSSSDFTSLALTCMHVYYLNSPIWTPPLAGQLTADPIGPLL